MLILFIGIVWHLNTSTPDYYVLAVPTMPACLEMTRNFDQEVGEDNADLPPSTGTALLELPETHCQLLVNPGIKDPS